MNEPLQREGREKGIGVYLLMCAVAALWVDFGSLHRLHNGDSLLPVLVSLQYWTPFQWELDRHGMLVPLLALPLAHPLANLLLQGFLDVFCGLAAFFLLARYMLRESIDPLVGALGATAFLTLAPAPYRFDYLMDVSYGVWLTLGLGGLLVAEPEPGVGARTWRRRLVALLLIILAHWVYSATALYLATLVVLRTVFRVGFGQRAVRFLQSVRFPSTNLAASAAQGFRSAPAQAILLLIAGFLAGRALTMLSIHQHTTFARIPPGEWPRAWANMVVQTRRALAPGVWPLALVSTAVLTLILNLVRARLRQPLAGQGSAESPVIPWREAAALVSTAFAVALYMGTRLWLKLNIYAPRYLLPSVFLTQAALAMLIVKSLGYPIIVMAYRGGRLPILVATMLLLGVTWAYGFPSPRRVRADIDRLGLFTPDVLAVGCTHIAGNYWTVWPAIFHVNLALYERGESRTVWGVTFGGQPTSMLWRTIPQEKRCVCIPVNDPYGDNWLLSFGFSRFRDVQRRATVRVLRRHAVASAAGPSL